MTTKQSHEKAKADTLALLEAVRKLVQSRGELDYPEVADVLQVAKLLTKAVEILDRP